MFMWPDFHLAKSFKIHLLLSALLACWVVLFLILLSPFDVSDLTTLNKWILLPFYGVLLVFSYLLSLPVQNWLVRRHQGRWHLGNEFLFIAVFFLVAYFACFAYYRSGIMNGTQNASTFFVQQFIPLSIIMMPMILFLRWTAGKLGQSSNKHVTNTKITLEGNSQKELLRLDFQQIAYVKAADNYVEVYYFEARQLQMKLLRSTLKKINAKAPALLRTHRSYLINPAHFQQWASPNSILIAQTEIPISKTYKAAIEKQLSFTTGRA